MSTFSVNGNPIMTATVTMPMFGAWVADIVLTDHAEIPEHVTLVLGDLLLFGTVVRQADFASSRSARIVGGSGGWRKELGAKGYSHPLGVRLSHVLNDVASETGERILVLPDRSLGEHWARSDGRAESTLTALTDGKWWVDPSGVTQIGPRPSKTVVAPFTVSAWSGGRGQFEILSESIAPWQPGNTFAGPTIIGAQVISSVTIEANNEGKVILHVLSSTSDMPERLLSGVRSIIASETATLLYAATWEYEIAPSLGLGLTTTVDCTSTDPRMPDLTRVPLFGIGIVSAPIAGAKCRIRFVNADPSRPECIAIDGCTEHLMTSEACALLIYNTFAALALVSPGPMIGLATAIAMPVAILAAITAQSIPAPPGIIAQAAAAAAQASNFTSGIPASTSAPFSAAIATAIGTKMPDVSGLFPGVGIPNG